jgi:dTDP-4-dehydrorhamnose 3,5-epimerase-like enzyme
MSLADVRLLDLHSVEDDRGVLTAIEAFVEVPFEIRRVFFLHGVRAPRGGHAHRSSCQFLVPIAGSFRVRVSDPGDSESFQLDEPHRGLFVPPLTWVHLDNFSANAVCLVLTDTLFDRAEYIREWDEFVGASRAPRGAA